MARVDTARLAAAAQASRPSLPWDKLSDMAAVSTVFTFLLLAAGAFMAFFFTGGWEVQTEPQDTTIPRLINLWMIIMAMIVTCLNFRALTEEFLRTPLLPLLLLLIASSVAWSVDPDHTFRHVLFLLSYTVLSVWLAIHFDMARLLRIHAYTSLCAMALSLVVAIVPPRIGLHADGDQLLRGIYVHKNVMGMALAMTAPALLLGWRHGFLPRWVCVTGYIVMLGMLLWAGSATSLGMAALMTAIFIVLAMLDMQRQLVAMLVSFGIAIVCAVGFLAVTDLQVFFDLVGRDATLTGRTDLWALVISRIEQHPWLGYGYRAFWALPENVLYAREAFGWAIPHSHSGYLETWLGLGLGGVVLVVLLVLQAIMRGFAAIAAGDRLTGEFAIILGIAYLVRNLTEADFAGTTTTWIFMIVTTVACSRALRHQRGREPFPLRRQMAEG